MFEAMMASRLVGSLARDHIDVPDRELFPCDPGWIRRFDQDQGGRGRSG